MGLAFLTLLKRDQKKLSSKSSGLRRQSKLKLYALGHIYASVAFALASSIGLAQAIPSLKIFSNMLEGSGGPFSVVAGTSLQVLQWLTMAFLALFALGTSMMFRDGRDVKAKSTKTSTGKAKAKTKTTGSDPLAMV